MKNLNMKKNHQAGVLDKKMNIVGVSKKFKVGVITAAITTLICTSTSNYAADLEIYKIPENSTGTATLMLMLDTSGSMAWNMGNTQTPSNSANSRLGILKKGLKDVLEGTPTVRRVEDKIVMGLSTFAGNNGFIRVPAKPLGDKTGNQVVETIFRKPIWIRYSNRVGSGWGATTTTYYNECNSWDENNYNCLTWKGDTTSSIGYTNSNPYKYTDNTDCTYGNRSDCRFVYQEIPKYRDETHRDVLLTEIASLTANGGTPTPYAYAEVASYLMGTRTQSLEEYTPITGISLNNDNTFYRPTCSAPTGQTLHGTGVDAGKFFNAYTCSNFGNSITLTDELKDRSKYGVFHTKEGNNTWKYYYQISNYTFTELEEVANTKSDGTDKQRCTSLKSSFENLAGTGNSAGTTISIKRCNNTSSSNIPSLTGLSSMIYGGNTNRRIIYYKTISTPVNMPAKQYLDMFSGWPSSTSDVKDTTNNKYIAPTSITSQLTDDETGNAKKECSGQGIYFLTDGEPEPNGMGTDVNDGKTGTAYRLMTSSLTDKQDDFTCAPSQLGTRAPYKNAANAWDCIGNYAKTLLDSNKNPLGLSIKTAVVGFSSSFSSETNPDVQDAKDWGTIGGGKWYVGTNSQSVVDSINNFINDIQKDIPSMSTGSSTIPIDALNPEIIQPYAYSPQFEPKADPADNRQLWFGNLKKYYVVNGGVYSSESGGSDNTVVKKSKLQDLADIWANENITYPENTAIFKKGGILSQLILGLVNGVNSKNEPVKKAGRKLLTEYDFDGTADEGNEVSRDFNLKQISYDYTTDEKTKNDDPDRIRSLMALLGINISDSTETNGTDLSGANAEENLRQMGSIYHSLPVLLTQEGKAVAEKNTTTNKVHISTTSRKDYIMFGTTQGLLTVVDADTGNEKFSFVPKEMIEKQSETFKENAGNLSGGKNALYYGIDGEWTAHTVYVTKDDGTLTVKGASRAILGKTPAEKENFDGKQWVYGGMRMGGRSYYSLDLTDIDNPKLKFHIDPSSGKVYSKDNPAGKSFSAIENMAQSWSKPKLDYVNWKGERKLVMFVGGGYDAGGDDGDGLYANGIRTGYAGYEHYNYVQDNKKGSGVYMFDADNGDLLWYANSDSEGEANIEHVSHSDLKYSIASDIKTIDRNNDGITDHLYFGDLAGQAFRVDFNGTKDSFTSQVNKILDLHVDDENDNNKGTSPRFYMAPVFTAHHSTHKKEGAHVVIATFISGNKSAPLLGTPDSPSNTGKKDPLNLQYDGVYAVYDYDIHPDGKFFPNTNLDARTLADVDDEASTTKLKLISTVIRSDTEDTLVKGAIANSTTGWGGWYYRFDKKFDGDDADASIVKGLSPLIAMEGSLYVTMYDASNNGTSSSCGAGVKGHSFTQRLCLPTGVCAENANYKYNLGAGIISLNVGSVDGGNTKSIVVPDPDDICIKDEEGECEPCEGTDCKSDKKFITAGGSIRFIPNRWFERYAKVE